MSALAEVPSGTTSARRERRRLQPPGLLVGIAIAYVAVVVLCAVLAPVIAPHDPSRQDLLLGATGPGPGHLLGTNDLGQDILSRLIYGSRTALIGPTIVALVSTALATAVGIAAGYHGGRVDTVVSRAVDVAMSVPVLLVAIVVIGVVGGGYPLAVALLSVAAAPSTVRLVRAAALEQRTRAYVEAAESLGVSPLRIMTRHMWPNVMPVALASAFLVFAFSLVLLSSLAFLGLGVGLNSPDWGRMLATAKPLMFETPSAMIAPGVALVALAAFMSIIGDWVYERVADAGRG